MGEGIVAMRGEGWRDCRECECGKREGMKVSCGGREVEGVVEGLCNSPKQKPVICNCEVGDLKWRERLVNEAILE